MIWIVKYSISTMVRRLYSTYSTTLHTTLRYYPTFVFISMTPHNSMNSRQPSIHLRKETHLSFEQFVIILGQESELSSVSMSSMRKSYRDYLKLLESRPTSLSEKFLKRNVKGSGLMHVIMSEVV
jgi:hypothetical protein